MAIDRDKLQICLSKWQEVLRLRDWDIKLEIIHRRWRKSGDIKIDQDDRKAVILINNTPKCTNLEELVVHELLHLKLWGMDQMIEKFINQIFGTDDSDPKRDFAMNQFFMLLESTVEDLAKGFLKASGCREELSFGRLQHQVDQEIK
ncbi:hypothetical protein JW979_01670 [bacterium]|nr:hypothetical protein [candidate division CSSED10-310 bacterium]